MNSSIENLEAVLSEAHKMKGWNWVCEEPLWTTWPLEKFGVYHFSCRARSLLMSFEVTSVSEILRPYRRSLDLHIEVVNLLRHHSVTFEVSRDAMNKWVEQPWLEEDGWDAKWEDLCLAEIDRWDSR